MKTQIDTQKEQADFLLKDTGKTYTVDTKGKEIEGQGVVKQYSNGRYEVTKAKFESMKSEMSWATDF